MTVRVAAIAMTNEKAWRDGKLDYFYSRPGMRRDEVEQIAAFYLDKTVRLVEQAAAHGARMVCLPENTIEINKWLKSVEPPLRFDVARWNWKRLLETLSDTSRRCRCVIVACANEPDGDRMYNAAAVLDDRGNYLGSYRKVQLTDGELEWLHRGETLPVFPTPWGKIGIFICWDIIFPEISQTLAMNGADILFQPTYGHAGHQADAMAMTRAHDAVCPLVVAMWNGASRIFDKDGKLLARAHRTRDRHALIPDQILYADLAPTEPRAWIDMADTRAALRRQRQWQLFGPLAAPPAAP